MKREVVYVSVFFVLAALAVFVISQTSITGNVIAAPAQDVKDTTVYLHTGTLLASVSEGETEYFIQDHLGSSRAVASGSDDEKQLTTYSPFGVTEISKSTDNDYLYTGKELDSETSLYYYGARYYLPETGRFISSDALMGGLGEPLALNRYAYVENNPLKYVDPSGNKIGSAIDFDAIRAARDINELLGEDVAVAPSPSSNSWETSSYYEITLKEDYEGDDSQMKIYTMLKELADLPEEINIEYNPREDSRQQGREVIVGKEMGKTGRVGNSFEEFTFSSSEILVHELAHAHERFAKENVFPTEQYAVEYQNSAREILGLSSREYYAVFESASIVEKTDSTLVVSEQVLGLTPELFDKYKRDFLSRGLLYKQEGTYSLEQKTYEVVEGLPPMNH